MGRTAIRGTENVLVAVKKRISFLFDNYDNIINFIKIINDAKGLAIGDRHITVSTCGLVPKIKEFSELDLQVNLALSLHAPSDEVRNKIMPINKAYNIGVYNYYTEMLT